MLIEDKNDLEVFLMHENNRHYYPHKRETVKIGGSFSFSVIGLEHDHVYVMIKELINAGANFHSVYDTGINNIEKIKKFYPGVLVCQHSEEIYNFTETNLIIGATIPKKRFNIGVRALESGKHFLSPKPGFVHLKEIEKAESLSKKKGLNWGIFYNERLYSESAIFAKDLLEQDAIGDVVQMIGTGPHRINLNSRPDWFFDKQEFGGIICDIGVHQIEQFLYYTNEDSAQLMKSTVANYTLKNHPNFEDFGDAQFITETGRNLYFRVDWLTPAGLSTWGDGRIVLLGTKGYIELRKYIDVARNKVTDNVYLVNENGETYFNVSGKIGLNFFAEFINDCLHKTDFSFNQTRTFEAARLAILAQQNSLKIS